MPKKILFPFEKHPKQKGTCPECKAEKSFRYYEGLSREFGVCDRTNNCGYHKKPGTEQLPDKNSIEDVKEEKKVTVIYPNTAFVSEVLKNQTSNFHSYCTSKLKISKDHLFKWNCGTIEDKTAFVYESRAKKVLNIVHIEYSENCKRNKTKFPYSLKAKPGTKYNLCLFGEHLLTDKTICLVESEKTAIIASFFYPQFDWLATGGANKLTDEKIFVLFTRKIFYLADADKAGTENSTIKKLSAYKQDFTIIHLFPERNDGYDIADAIIDGLHPEIKTIEKSPQALPATGATDSTANINLVFNDDDEKPHSKNISDFERVEKFLSYRYEIRFNEVSNEIEFRTKGSKDGFSVLNENNVYIELQKNFINFSQAKVTALLRSDYVTVYNPFNDYFENLPKWSDTEPDFIGKVCEYLPVNTADTERLKNQYKKHLVRSIACALLPGVFNKQSFILVHDQQNSGKSTFVRWHCPPVLSDYITENISTDKDSLICLSDNFIINMDELATLNKAEINTLKAMMSKDVIKVRRPYDKKPVLTPRRATFWGSTNKTEFLSDETGSVRWICFELQGPINFDYKKDIDINDVWRQAYSLFINGFKYELTPEEIRANEAANSSYQIVTDEQEFIRKALVPSDKEHSMYFMTATDVKTYLLEKYPFAKLNTINIGKALKTLGFKKESQRDEKFNYPIKVYYVDKLVIEDAPYNADTTKELKSNTKNIVGKQTEVFDTNNN